MIKKTRIFFKRQSIVPFETMFGFFCMYGGVAGIFAWGITNDIFKRTVGDRWSFILNIAYLLAGSGMYLGIGLNRKDVESIGLITVASSLLIRSFVMAVKVGMNPMLFNSYILTAAFIFACLTRCYKLLTGSILIEITETENQNTTLVKTATIPQ